MEEESKIIKKGSIKPKNAGKQLATTLVDQSLWEREEAARENERTIKKLMVEITRLQGFMRGLLENYSLPENLQEDIKELLYE